MHYIDDLQKILLHQNSFLLNHTNHIATLPFINSRACFTNTIFWHCLYKSMTVFAISFHYNFWMKNRVEDELVHHNDASFSTPLV